ncbi:hypothetical protein J3R83DRAFT_13710 [Lanmaoa asiatica]|nr:hypothetical protein J3R83DRAFT_13710 [Lanmaoa asiatica]
MFSAIQFKDVFLRSTLLQQDAGLQEVEVDQRALVNILSRYPESFDVLRELIQNADDAEARNVEVHFQSAESPPTSESDVSKLNVCKWIIKDDGMGFYERLGRIADGNDSSSKIGGFGIGFYSVLSKSDRPLVRSNGRSVQFDRGEDGKVSPRTPGGNILTENQLRKRFAQCELDSWTSVELELRILEPLPVLVDLGRFLVSSVAFLVNIHTISVHLDSQRVVHIQKRVQLPVDIPIPQHLKPTTPLQALTVESIQRSVQRIAVDATEWAFASSLTTSPSLVDTDGTLVERPGRSGEDYPTHTSRNAETILEENAIMHDLCTVTIRVTLYPDSEMKRGVESSMKLLPPSFKCKAVYFNSEQSLTGINNSHSPQGETSCPPFLRLTGHFSRERQARASVYCPTYDDIPPSELSSGRLFIGQSTNQTTGIGLHISAHFLPTMERDSIDLANGQVAGWNKEVLWASGFLARIIYEEEMRVAAKSRDDLATQLDSARCFLLVLPQAKLPFPVVSNAGISDASDSHFRQSNKDLSFLKTYPVLHEEVESRQHSQIISRCGIPLFKFGDIVQEFESGATQDAMTSFFVWWEDVRKNSPSSPEARVVREKLCKQFASRGVPYLSDGVKIAFKTIKYFSFFSLPNGLSPRTPSTSTSPWVCLPGVSSNVSARGSGQVSDVGHRILCALVQFALVEDLSRQQWDQVAELVKDLECIATNMGLKLPADSYFDEADVSGSLPSREVSSLDWWTRNMYGKYWPTFALETAASEESNYRLLQYLIIVLGGRLTDRQIGDLKKNILYSKNHGRASAIELLLPNEDMLKLGLPILALPRNGIASLQSVIDPSGSFAVEQFIEFLGVQRYPALEKIIALAASDTPEVQRSALQYLLSNLETRYNAYKPDDFANVGFIPTKSETLACLNEVCASPIWEKLGFKQVPETLLRDLSRLGIKEDPSVDMIIECFKTLDRRPSDIDTAASWFELLYLHGKFLIPKLREDLSRIPFVPVKGLGTSSSASSPIEYICPKDCFTTSADTKEHYRDIFPFVDFGQHGNGFLESCCAKKLPDVSDIVHKILQDPPSYLEVLRNDVDLRVGCRRHVR